MTVRQLPLPKFHLDKGDGTPASGWKIYTYEPGTSTAKATYTTSAGDVANANPVVLNSRGEADIWWDGLYKVIVTDENDVTIYTVDNHGTGLTPISSTQLSLVPNYSFEEATDNADTPDDWTITLYTDGTQSLDTTAGNQIHGGKALKFTSVGTGGGYATSAFFPVQEAVLVGVAVAMKSSVADVRNVVEIIWYDRSQVSLSTTSLYDASSGNPTSWTDQNLSGTPPSNARYAKIRLTGCHSSDATTGSTWFDNVRVASSIVLPFGTQTIAGDKTFTGATTFSGAVVASGSTTLGTAVVNSSGVMTAGTIPLARMQRAYAENTGTGSSLTVSLGTVVADDAIEVMVNGDVTISSAAVGNVEYIVSYTGTATLTNAGSSTFPRIGVTTTAGNTIYYFCTTLLFKVTVGGTASVGVTSRGVTGVTVSSNNLRVAARCLVGV